MVVSVSVCGFGFRSFGFRCMTTTACTRRSSHGQEAEADGEKNVAEVGELNAGGERGLIATQSEACHAVVKCR